MLDRYFSKATSLWRQINRPSFVSLLIITLLFSMFPLAYLESLRWPLPGPRATHGLLKGLFLVLSASLLIFRKKLPLSKAPIQNLLMVWLVACYALSAAFSQVLDSSLLHLWYPLIACSVLWAFSKIKFTDQHVQTLTWMSFFLVTLTFGFSLLSLLFRYSVESLYSFIFLEHRATLLLTEIRETGKYVSLGPYLFLLPIVSRYLVDTKATLLQKLCSISALAMGIMTAVISNHRIDFLVVSIQVGILLMLVSRKTAIVLVTGAIPLLLIGLTISESFFGFSLVERILHPRVERDQQTISIRFVYWQTALENFRAQPILGTGPNTFNDVSSFPIRQYYNQASNANQYRTNEGIGVHNVFFERLSDTGLFGFTAFMMLLFYFVRRDWHRIWSEKNIRLRNRYLLFALSSWSWLLYSLTDNGYGAQGYVVFYYLRGVLLHV